MGQNEQIKQEFYQLLEKYTCGEANAEEVARLNDVYERFQQQTPDSLPANIHLFRQRQLDQLLHEILQDGAAAGDSGSSRDWRFGTTPRIAVAVAFVIVSLVGVYLFLQRQSPMETQWVELVAQRGELKEVTLSDGTEVHLNSNSTLRYPLRFEEGNRQVQLLGEAFFNVKKDKNAPFLIQTDKMDIQVLGTTLNVRAYPGDRIAETALLTGSVQIISKSNPEEVVVLKPNQKYTEHYDSSIKQKIKDDTDDDPPEIAPYAVRHQVTEINSGILQDIPQETEWMLQRLTIRDETLEEIAVELERRYDVKIHFQNPAVGKQRYSASFENEELDNLLKALQLVTPFKYRKEVNGAIIIY